MECIEWAKLVGLLVLLDPGMSEVGDAIGSDGAVTFRTGDVYSRSAEQRLIWKGRNEDYIQVRSFLVES